MSDKTTSIELLDDPLEAIADGAPLERNLYFYFGWMAHKRDRSYDDKTAIDWQYGWHERESRGRK